jgi:GDP-D-mannose 3', 5'-epimerase
MMLASVTGAGGMIGGHMVRRLLDDGYEVRAVDIKPMRDWWQVHPEAENLTRDVCYESECHETCRGADVVFDFACRMGGIGYIETNRADCALSVMSTANMMRVACEEGVPRFFKSSSACVYAAEHQTSTDVESLAEWMAYPAAPEAGYGEEKLFGEQLARYMREDYGMETRVARYHNIAGPPLSWDDGKEKAPAAICRKVAEAKLSGRHIIDIWGDGEQTRSFCWIGDCIEGTVRLTFSDHVEPLNIGSDELVSINQLVTLVEMIAGVECERRYDLTAPQGVRGRNSDNTLINATLGWEPTTRLDQWMPILYEWIEEQVSKRNAA